MQQLGRLVLDGGNQAGLAVADAHHADAAEEVQVLAALVVVQAHALAADELHRLAGKGLHHMELVELPLLVELDAHGGPPFLTEPALVQASGLQDGASAGVLEGAFQLGGEVAHRRLHEGGVDAVFQRAHDERAHAVVGEDLEHE